MLTRSHHLPVPPPLSRRSSAKVFPTTRSRVPLKEILNTNLFDFEKAATGAGWLQSLKEDNMITHVAADGSTRRVPKPETLECVLNPDQNPLGRSLMSTIFPFCRYGISSFVYRERRPFHPERLWELMSKPFAVIQTSFEEEEEDSDDDGSEADASDDDDEDASDPERSAAQVLAEEKAALDLPARAKFKREHSVWKTLLRSKGQSGLLEIWPQRVRLILATFAGFCWLATRNDHFGEWSQAGVSLKTPTCTVQ